MWLKILGLEHFGQLSHQRIELKPGLNVIYGENESGKTTIHCFIKGMLFGIEKGRGREGKRDLYEKYRPWDTPDRYSGYMELEAGGRAYRVVRNFYRETKEAFYIDLETGRKEACGGVPPFLDAACTKAYYENTVSAAQDEEPAAKELSGILKNKIAGAGREDKIDLKKALYSLAGRKKELRLTEAAQAVKEADSALEEIEKSQERWDALHKALLSVKKEYDESNKDAGEEMSPGGERRGRAVPLIWGLPGLALLLLAALSYVFRFLPYPVSILLFLGGFLCSGAGILLRQSRDSKTRREALQKERIREAETREELRIKLERLRWEMQAVEESISHREEWQLKREERIRKLMEQQESLQAIDLAGEIISGLAAELKEEAGLPLGNKITEFMKAVTDGRYTGIYTDGDLSFTVRRGDRFLDGARLSRGTKDELFLGLRIAAGDWLYEGETMPLILDDSLAFCDDRRMGRTLSGLAGLDRQTLLFTCHKREAEYLKAQGIQFHHVVL